MKLYKRMQQRLALTIVAATVLTTAAPNVFAADYDKHWAAQSIQEWKDKGIINGYEDGTFRPKENIKRAELAAILVRVFGLTETTGAQSFSDVKSTDWYANDVAKISAAGIMHVEGTSFKPNSYATREEAAYAVANAYKITGSTDKVFEDQSKISTWAEAEISALVAGGYVSGRTDGTFAPKDYLTRAEMVAMIDKITAEFYNEAGEYSGNVKGNVVINTKDVVLKDMTINGNLYISEGVGNGDVTLENVVINGEVFVEGGGVNSIKLKGSTLLNKVTVDKANGEVRIVTSENAKVGQIFVESGVKLEGQFGEVSLTNKVAVEVLANSTIGKLIVDQNAKDLSINLAAGVTVKEAVLNTSASLTGSGKITLVTLADGVKASDVSLKVSIGAVKDNAGNNVLTTTPGGGGGSGSNGDSSSSVVSTYRVKGKLTINKEAINYGSSKFYGRVKLTPIIVVDGKETLDTSKMITVDANNKGEFDFGKVAKGQKYYISASYDKNGKDYKAEYIISNLSSDQTLTINLEEVVISENAPEIGVYGVKVLDERTIQVTMDQIGSVRGSVSTISGGYITKWQMSGDKQITTVILPEGKTLEANKEYILSLKQDGYKNYTCTIQWKPNSNPETPETTTPGQVVVNKATLEATIKKVEVLKLDKATYTTESFVVLEKALEAAKEVVAKEAVTQDEVTQAVNALMAAVKGLEKVETTTPGEDSDEDTSSPVVSSYSIKGQLTINEEAIDYGHSTYYGSVKLAPIVVVDGEEKLDTSKIITVRANDKGEFDFGQAAKGQKYGVYATYDVNGKDYKSEVYVIDNLDSDQTLAINLKEVVIAEDAKDIVVHSVKVLNESTIQVIMDQMGSVRAAVSTISGGYTTKWEMSGDKQITTVILPEGKKLEANKDYALLLKQNGYKDYTVSIKWQPETTTPDQVVVNKEALKAEIQRIEDLNLDPTEYTTTSFTVLQNALKSANRVLIDETATQELVNGVRRSLEIAYERLIKVGTTNPSEIVAEWSITTGSALGVSIEELVKQITTSGSITLKDANKVDLGYSVQWRVTTASFVTTPGSNITPDSIVTTNQITTPGTYTVVGTLIFAPAVVPDSIETQTYKWIITTTSEVGYNYKVEVVKVEEEQK